MNDSNSEEFWDYANKILDDEVFLLKTKLITEDEEMIKAVKPLFNWAPSTSNDNNRFKKNSNKSMKYAEEAIKASNNEERMRCIKLANMITAFAKDGGDLALAHSIRSQTFYALKTNFYQGIEELEACLKIPRPPKKIKSNIKLDYKNGQIGSPNLTKQELTRILKQLQATSESPGIKKQYEEEEKEEEKKRQFCNDLYSLKSPNPKAPALEDFVEIKYNSVKGRHLIVTKDVPAGTTLLVEKPFVAGLADIFNLEISHCHNCLKQGFRPTPCPNCVFVLFCSEKCLEESKEYHKKYECSIFPDLYSVLSSIETSYVFLGAYKTVCTFGPHELFRAFQKEQESLQKTSTSKEEKKKPKDFVIPGFDPETGMYDPSSFHTMNHTSRMKNFCSAKDVLIALALIKILETRTDFFQQVELVSQVKSQKLKTKFQDFVTLFLLKMSTSNFMSKGTKNKYSDAPVTCTINWSFNTQPISKLVSHSCDWNFETYRYIDMKGLDIVGVALRDLKKGEEIVRCYRSIQYPFSFDKKPKSVRQSELMKRFDFKCECVACLNDWSLMETLEAEKDRPKFCCPLCSSKIPPEPEMMTKENYEKIALNSGNNFICSECKFENKEKELLTQFKRNTMALNIAENLINEGSGIETLKSLKAASSFFQNHLIPPSFYQIKCKDLIQRPFQF